jgi:hypothetical protein
MIAVVIHLPGHWAVVAADMHSYEIVFYDSQSRGDVKGHRVVFQDYLKHVYEGQGLLFPNFTMREHLKGAGWPTQSDGALLLLCYKSSSLSKPF